MHRPLAYDGLRFKIVYAVCADRSSPGLDFYDALHERDQAKLNKLFQYMGDHGRISNEEKFKKIEKTDFFEFKSHQIRMPCFFSAGRLLVITHGFVKQSDSIRLQELRRAERIKTEDESFAKNIRQQ